MSPKAWIDVPISEHQIQCPVQTGIAAGVDTGLRVWGKACLVNDRKTASRVRLRRLRQRNETGCTDDG